MAKRGRNIDGKPDELVLLKDLVPRKDPKGGRASKPVFGEHTPEPEPARDRSEQAPRRPKKGER